MASPSSDNMHDIDSALLRIPKDPTEPLGSKLSTQLVFQSMQSLHEFQTESIQPSRVPTRSISQNNLPRVKLSSFSRKQFSSSLTTSTPSTDSIGSSSMHDVESALLCIPEDPIEQVNSTRSVRTVLSRSHSSALPSLSASSNARHRKDGLAFKKPMPNRRHGFIPALLGPASLDFSFSSSDLLEEDIRLNISNHVSPDVELAIKTIDEDPPVIGKTSWARLDGEDEDEEDETESMISRTSSLNSLRSSFRNRISYGNLRKRAKKKKDQARHDSDTSTFDAPRYNFLAKDDNKAKVSLHAGARWWRGVFVISFISLLACIITLWAPPPIGARMPSDTVAQYPWSDGCQGLQSCICPRETICADDLMSMIFLTIARASAWFDYPLYMLLFLSKARNLNNFLQKTMLKCWINFSDFHRVHALFGIIVGMESIVHGFFHILRWARRKDDIQLLWTHQTGITGLIALLVCPIIVLPMTIPFVKNKISFKWRKGLHYLSILWAICLMFHAPQRIYWLIGIPLAIYVADQLYGVFYKTHLVENAYFERLGDSSCVITFQNPPSFGKQNSAYAYIMLPWLSKYQFHVFSIYPSSKPNYSQFCISKSGTWTGDLIQEITTPTHKPMFVIGPYLSPFNSPAMDSQNLIAVASGIGVTPVISLIKQYVYTQRCLNLIWICRDPGLVEHFLNNVMFDFGDYGYILIYYTGKRLLMIEKDLPPNVLIYQGRPNLERTVSGIISSISCNTGLPAGVNEGMKTITKTPPYLRAKVLLEKALSIYTTDQLFQYAMEVTNSNHKDLELEPLVDSVDYRGVLALMQQLLKDSCRPIQGKITKTFERFNSVAPHLLNRDEFEAFINIMLDQGQDDVEDASVLENAGRDVTFQSKPFGLEVLEREHNRRLIEDEFKIKHQLQGSGEFAAKNWSLLYCGGSEVVLEELEKYRRQFGIALSVEKFDW